MNGNVGPADALVDFIIKKTEGRAELVTDRQKTGKLTRLDSEIAGAEAVVRKRARDEAIAAIEEQFGGVAA